MGTKKVGRTALTDITNHVKKGTQQAPCDNEARKREERNRKQREYRARKKAQETNIQRDGMTKLESSPCTSSIDQQSPYGQGYSTDLRASMVLQTNELTLSGSILSPYGTRISTVLQASSVEDKENHYQCETIDWLHRNDNYVKRHKDTHVVDDVNKRERRNIKQREYRARRKAEEIDEYREWIINKKHCGYKRCADELVLARRRGLEDANELEHEDDNESRVFRGEVEVVGGLLGLMLMFLWGNLIGFVIQKLHQGIYMSLWHIRGFHDDFLMIPCKWPDVTIGMRYRLIGVVP
ncbi:hypothetical protein GUJ93_ZPchr0006g41186 [Zizania palustris]|uniref:Uncharacterized protein n=1 Tax=Zizania palustris TaxID=103762 RepID=A0A8J5T6F3_ZIZPA|nr:hypothetical protein GUJ93_ZPchr0006g41186 [Zizania palustris]